MGGQASQWPDPQTRQSWREARKAEGQLLEEVGAGRHKSARKMTIRELLLDEWLPWRKTNGKGIGSGRWSAWWAVVVFPGPQGLGCERDEAGSELLLLRQLTVGEDPHPDHLRDAAPQWRHDDAARVDLLGPGSRDRVRCLDPGHQPVVGGAGRVSQSAERERGFLSLAITGAPDGGQPDGDDLADGLAGRRAVTVTRYLLGFLAAPVPPPLFAHTAALHDVSPVRMPWRQAGALLHFNELTGAMEATTEELAELRAQLDRTIAAATEAEGWS